MRAIPMEGISLPLPLDHHTALARALGHGLGHIGRVNIAVSVVINRTLKVFRADERPALLDLIRGQPFIGHTTSFCCRGIEHIFVHTLLRLRHTQVPDHGEACIQACFSFKLFVKLDRVLMNMRRRI